MKRGAFYAILMALIAVGIMASAGCRETDVDRTDRPSTPSAVLLVPGGTVSVYDYHLQVSVNERGRLTLDELNWFRDRLLEGVQLDITKVAFMQEDLTDSIPMVKGSVAFLFNAIKEVVYYTPGDAEPPEDTEENFWKCVGSEHLACVKECYPDESYLICVHLCMRETKIKCASKDRKGRFSRKSI